MTPFMLAMWRLRRRRYRRYFLLLTENAPVGSLILRHARFYFVIFYIVFQKRSPYNSMQHYVF